MVRWSTSNGTLLRVQFVTSSTDVISAVPLSGERYKFQWRRFGQISILTVIAIVRHLEL